MYLLVAAVCLSHWKLLSVANWVLANAFRNGEYASVVQLLTPLVNRLAAPSNLLVPTEMVGDIPIGPD